MTELYIPLFGVILGWLLNELSQAIRYSRENKPYLSQAIGSICHVLFILETRRDYLNSAIEAGRLSKKGHEFLMSITDNGEKEILALKEKTKIAISNLEKFEPFIAHELAFFLNNAIESTERNQGSLDLYGPDLENIKILIIELNIDIGKFHHFIKSLTIKHSIILYVKYILDKKRNKRDSPSPFKQVFEEI